MAKDDDSRTQLTAAEEEWARQEGIKNAAAEAQANVSHGIEPTYTYRPEPGEPMGQGQASQYARTPAMLPTGRSRSAVLGSQVGSALGKLGSGFISGYMGKKNAQAVASNAQKGIQATKEAESIQRSKDAALARKQTGQPVVTPPAAAAPSPYGNVSVTTPVTSLPGSDGTYAPSPTTSAFGATNQIAPTQNSPDYEYQPTPEPNTTDTPSGTYAYGDEAGSTSTPVAPPEDLPDAADLANATSDERSKTSRSPASDLVDGVKPYSYEYKPGERGPTAPPGRHYGVMAQDLERTKVGRTMVQDDPRTGRKTVNYGQGLGAMMAGLADVHSRIKKLEGKK